VPPPHNLVKGSLTPIFSGVSLAGLLKIRVPHLHANLVNYTRRLKPISKIFIDSRAKPNAVVKYMFPIKQSKILKALERTYPETLI
jgi:hypothetical protein